MLSLSPSFLLASGGVDTGGGGKVKTQMVIDRDGHGFEREMMRMDMVAAMGVFVGVRLDVLGEEERVEWVEG